MSERLVPGTPEYKEHHLKIGARVFSNVSSETKQQIVEGMIALVQELIKEQEERRNADSELNNKS